MHKKVNPSSLFFLFSAIITLLLVSGCESRHGKETLQVSLEKKSEVRTRQVEPASKLRVAISAIISPKQTFILYNELLEYIGRKMDLDIELIQRETYAEVNNLVRNNELDVAFVCSGAYVDGHDQFGMELLVAPVAYGEPVYYSYIIVPADSTFKSINDLRGKKFAFTDPMSNTGKLSPTYLLAQMDETPENFFESFIFTYSHDRSIEMVAHKLVDGAAVDSLIWDYMNANNTGMTSLTRIVSKSDPYGIPPIVIPANLDPTLKDRLRNILLEIHKDEVGREILDRLQIDKFISLDDSRYDSIRKMQAFFAK